VKPGQVKKFRQLVLFMTAGTCSMSNAPVGGPRGRGMHLPPLHEPQHLHAVVYRRMQLSCVIAILYASLLRAAELNRATRNAWIAGRGLVLMHALLRHSYVTQR
jgi:hypothetical protein